VGMWALSWDPMSPLEELAADTDLVELSQLLTRATSRDMTNHKKILKHSGCKWNLF
jgi:hypothetical protein